MSKKENIVLKLVIAISSVLAIALAAAGTRGLMYLGWFG
tara:strand:+ start:91 stop:207 length:117 start_codon:yes stop_codon:yes gene_type:complete